MNAEIENKLKDLQKELLEEGYDGDNTCMEILEDILRVVKNCSIPLVSICTDENDCACERKFGNPQRECINSIFTQC